MRLLRNTQFQQLDDTYNTSSIALLTERSLFSNKSYYKKIVLVIINQGLM